MNKDSKSLRKFGITMAVAFAVVAGILFWREKEIWKTFIYVAGGFLATGLILPIALSPIEWVWMKFAHYLSIVMTYVLVTLTFFIAITPLGLIMRLFGKELIAKKFDKSRKSYWVPVEPDGPHSRPDKPY